MAKQVFIVRAWVESSDPGYRHLHLEVNLAEKRDAARVLSEVVKGGSPWQVEGAQERVNNLIEAGRRSTVYYSASDTTRVAFRWQSDRDNGFENFYSFRLAGLRMDQEALAVLSRVSKVLDKAGALGAFSERARPVDVWAALQAAGAVYVDWCIPGSCWVDGAVPDFLLPVEVEESSEAA